MSIYDLKVKTRKGDDFDLKSLKGKVSLVVNTATGCGFTPQYEAIAKMSKTCTKEGDIVWNFTKFLVDKNGKAVRRYDPTFDPAEIEKDLKELL